MRRDLPEPTPETIHFWEGCKAGELRLQRCDACAEAYFPPRPFCPRCGSRDISVFAASGKARLHSYVISHRPPPWLTDAPKEPHSIAVVELEEGVRMMTNVIGCPQTPEALQLDMPLEVIFEQASETIALPQFQPVEG
jgi:uncharacterized OB-fold protein